MQFAKLMAAIDKDKDFDSMRQAHRDFLTNLNAQVSF